MRQLMGIITPVNIDQLIIHRDMRDAEGFSKLLADWSRIRGGENCAGESKVTGATRNVPEARLFVAC